MSYGDYSNKNINPGGFNGINPDDKPPGVDPTVKDKLNSLGTELLLKDAEVIEDREMKGAKLIKSNDQDAQTPVIKKTQEQIQVVTKLQLPAEPKTPPPVKDLMSLSSEELAVHINSLLPEQLTELNLPPEQLIDLPDEILQLIFAAEAEKNAAKSAEVITEAAAKHIETAAEHTEIVAEQSKTSTYETETFEQNTVNDQIQRELGVSVEELLDKLKSASNLSAGVAEGAHAFCKELTRKQETVFQAGLFSGRLALTEFPLGKTGITSEKDADKLAQTAVYVRIDARDPKNKKAYIRGPQHLQHLYRSGSTYEMVRADGKKETVTIEKYDTLTEEEYENLSSGLKALVQALYQYMSFKNQNAQKKTEEKEAPQEARPQVSARGPPQKATKNVRKEIDGTEKTEPRVKIINPEQMPYLARIKKLERQQQEALKENQRVLDEIKQRIIKNEEREFWDQRAVDKSFEDSGPERFPLLFHRSVAA